MHQWNQFPRRNQQLAKLWPTDDNRHLKVEEAHAFPKTNFALRKSMKFLTDVEQLRISSLRAGLWVERRGEAELLYLARNKH